MMDSDELIQRIRQRYPDATIDIAGENCSFEVYVIDDAFSGMKTLERQRTVLALFAAEITSGQLHALTVKARTPAEMSQHHPASLVQLG